MRGLICFAVAAAWAVGSIAALAGDELSQLPKRPAWTTSNFRGRPEPPPPYRVEEVYPRLRFEKTTLLEIEPGSGRFFVGERRGKLYCLPKDRAATAADLFLDASQLVDRLNA